MLLQVEKVKTLCELLEGKSSVSVCVERLEVPAIDKQREWKRVEESGRE
jgi:hypothetical protein